MWKAFAPLIEIVVDAVVRAIKKYSYKRWRENYAKKFQERVDRAGGSPDAK